MEQKAVRMENRYIMVQQCDKGYHYSIYDEYFSLLDSGTYNRSGITLEWSLKKTISTLKKTDIQQLRGLVQMESSFVEEDFESLLGAVSVSECERRIYFLTVGNRGDDIALRNICEANEYTVDDAVNDDMVEEFFECNSFFYSVEGFLWLYADWNMTANDMEKMVAAGEIVATSDGYVWLHIV